MQPAPPPDSANQQLPAKASFGRRGLAHFVATFALCVAAYYVLSGTASFRESLFPAYLRLNALVTAAALRAIGQGVRVDDNCIFSARFFLTVERGCDAIEPTVLLIAA